MNRLSLRLTLFVNYSKRNYISHGGICKAESYELYICVLRIIPILRASAYICVKQSDGTE